MAKKLLDPIPPEILLKEFMRPLGISINRLARDIAVPRGPSYRGGPNRKTKAFGCAGTVEDLPCSGALLCRD
jgi:hypothetical protein